MKFLIKFQIFLAQGLKEWSWSFLRRVVHLNHWNNGFTKIQSNVYLIIGFVSYNKSLIGFKTSYFWIFGKITWIIDLNRQSGEVLTFDFISKAREIASIKLINILLIGSHPLNSYLSIHFPVLWL